MAILRIRDEKGKIFEIPSICGKKGDKGDPGKDAITDQAYTPESENAQSGKAVAEAMEDTKQYVDSLVGDIETALDGIIAIQNELIGGEEE